MKFVYLSKKLKHWKYYVKYDIVFLKYTQISKSLMCFLCEEVKIEKNKKIFFKLKEKFTQRKKATLYRQNTDR